jgi:hypothetical protein
MVGTFCEADFSSKEDLEDFFGLYRNHMLQVMKAVGKLGSVPTLTFAGQALAKLHGAWGKAAAHGVGEAKETQSIFFPQWEAMSALWESAMAGAYPPIEAQLCAAPSAGPGCNALLSPTTTPPPVATMHQLCVAPSADCDPEP